MSVLDSLRRPPFNLDDRAIAWVSDRLASLTLAEKVSQIFVLILIGKDDEAFETIKRLKPGGVTRFFTPDLAYEREKMADIAAACPVPLVVSADMEGSRHSFAFGTPVPGQLGLAALDDPDTTHAMSRIMAEEGRAMGVTWSFTPVLDINSAFRSAIVGTRSYGSDPEKVERHARAHMKALQENGVAATAKHWPGEGFDDRDQHLVTTINPLSLDDWHKTFGRLYKALIDDGVMSVMSAHIALPSYVLAQDPDAGIEAYRPASLSWLLTTRLLREELGFNGIIVSDASDMGGASSWGHHLNNKPDMLAAGCDVILFSDHPEADMAAVQAAVEEGRIPLSRLDEAVTRMLGLKAWLGLFDNDDVLPPAAIADARLARPENRDAALHAIAKTPTLEKDVAGLFPISPESHRRVLIVDGGINHPLIPRPLSFVLPELMRSEGFEVTIDNPAIEASPGSFDLVLYLLGDESLLVRNHIFVDWHRLSGGNLGKTMYRPWTALPSAMISFGHPYHLYDAPRIPAYINAWSTMDEVQRAVLDCMLGRTPFNRTSPVDAFCGLPDARF